MTTTQQVRQSGARLIVRATVLAAALTVLGSVLGLVRDLLLARFFGATGQTDAFLVAWTVPETASPLLIEGAMTFLMVPIFVRSLHEQGSLRPVVRATMPRIAGLLAVAAAVVALAAPYLVHLLAPGLVEPGIAVRCTRVAAVTVLMFGLAGYLGAALRSAHVFGWPASIYIAYNVGILGCMLLLRQQLGVVAAAIGVAAGSVLMVAVQLPAFCRRLRPGETGRPTGRPPVPLVAFVPIAVFTLTRHAQVFVERILGSELSAGTISHLNYAQKIAQVPMALSIMVATVTFPMLARSIATGDEDGSRHHMQRDLTAVSAVVLAASAYLIAFATPIVRVLFEHGAFTERDTAATASIMRVYALGLLGQAAVGVLTRSYYSHRRPTWYPAVVMAAGLAVTALVGVVLLPAWHGLAIAAGNAAGITLTAALMLRGPRQRRSAVPVARVAGSLVRLVVMAGAAGGIGWLFIHVATALPAAVTLLAGAVLVAAVFVLCGAVIAAPEIRPLMTLVSKLHRPGDLATPPLVLMYHSVSDGDDPYRVSVSPHRFAEQMRWLTRHGLRGTSMAELLDAADRGCADGLVGLTFDDGYADFVHHVMPVLTRHGFTATVFVVAGKLGGHNDWDEPGPLRPLMTAEQVLLAARNGIEIGSHGLGHRLLSRVDPDTLRRETQHSRQILQSLVGVPVRGFCYPYGELSDDARTAARAAGYDYAVATWASARRARHALPRTYVGQGDGAARLRAKLIRHRLIWGAG